MKKKFKILTVIVKGLGCVLPIVIFYLLLAEGHVFNRGLLMFLLLLCLVCFIYAGASFLVTLTVCKHQRPITNQKMKSHNLVELCEILMNAGFEEKQLFDILEGCRILKKTVRHLGEHHYFAIFLPCEMIPSENELSNLSVQIKKIIEQDNKFHAIRCTVSCVIVTFGNSVDEEINGWLSKADFKFSPFFS